MLLDGVPPGKSHSKSKIPLPVDVFVNWTSPGVQSSITEDVKEADGGPFELVQSAKQVLEAI